MNIDTYWPGNCPTKQTTLSTSGWHRRRLLAAPERHFSERRKRVWQSGHHERYGDTAGSVVFVLYVAPFKYLVQNHLDCCSLDSRFKVALVSGLCTAGGAYAPTMSDVAVITHRIGRTCWTFLRKCTDGFKETFTWEDHRLWRPQQERLSQGRSWEVWTNEQHLIKCGWRIWFV